MWNPRLLARGAACTLLLALLVVLPSDPVRSDEDDPVVGEVPAQGGPKASPAAPAPNPLDKIVGDLAGSADKWQSQKKEMILSGRWSTLFYD